jgi:DNA processing protein
MHVNCQGEALRSLLALMRIPSLGPSKLAARILRGERLEDAFNASGECQWMAGKANWTAVDKDLAWQECAGNHHIISLTHPAYPPLLKEISGAPVILFVKGNLDILSKPQIAMIGSRNPSPLGRETAQRFAAQFVTVGFVVTSGLALGIDGASHSGALVQECSTVGVLGNGLDRIYPAVHGPLASQIVERGGALLSEFPIGAPPKPTHFPRRNRVISGLSVGTLVVEATLKSGSLITARYAVEQGREVFAIPGTILHPLARGCHALIKQGAKLVETPEDVLEEIESLTKYVIRTEQVAKGVTTERRSFAALDASHQALLAQIGYDSTPVDVIIIRSGLTVSEVSVMLLELEVQGLVVAVPGGYARVLA